MNKPDILYHASESNDLIRIDPRTDEEKLRSHGPLLFATPYKPLAAMFLAPKVMPVEICKFGDEFVLVVEGDPEKFIANDFGGTIYELPSRAFVTSQDLQMPGTEYVSNQSVTPLLKEGYATSLDAMKTHGVGVYFVDGPTMSAIRSAEDHGYQIIKGLDAYLDGEL